MRFPRLHIMIPLIFVMLGYAAPHTVYGASLIARSTPERIKVFYTDRDSTGWTAVPRGEIISTGVRHDAHTQELTKMVQNHTSATVRLYNTDGIKKGDHLFVVNSKNLVVARLEVKIIYHSNSFGPMLIGYGNFRYSSNGFMVVQKVEDSHSKYAYIYKARGDFHKLNGEHGKAIEQYKKSLEMDRRYPEAHLALGEVYLKDDMIPFAAKEFSEAYRFIDLIYDNEDRYLLLKNLTGVRYRQAYEYTIPGAVRKAHIREGIKYAEEALKIYPDSREVNFHLAMFYYRGPESQDVKAKNRFMKVIEIDPMNADAFMALAELYRKHDNRDKALHYARKALEASPESAEARRLLNVLQ